MDYASVVNGIVVGTGDLSELALGWCTYNGDHMSMYGVNGGVPKTLVRSLVKWAAENRFEGMGGADGRSIKEILLDIVDTPISPELVPSQSDQRLDQVTEDIVGPYELHDFFIYNTLRYAFRPGKVYALAQIAFRGTYDSETIKRWLTVFYRRFFTQQFKRSCMPDGPVTGKCNLSPPGGWIMPADINGTGFVYEESAVAMPDGAVKVKLFAIDGFGSLAPICPAAELEF